MGNHSSNTPQQLIKIVSPSTEKELGTLKINSKEPLLNVQTLKYETPRKSIEQDNSHHGFPNNINITTAVNLNPLNKEERLQLSELRLNEIFNQYSKKHSDTAGKNLTFDKISKGLETLTLAGVTKLLKDYRITEFNKVKLHYLFKRYASDGHHITY